MTLSHGASCPLCGEGVLALQRVTHRHYYKGQSCEFAGYTSYACSACGEELENSSDNAEITRQILDFQRRVDGLLTPKEIKTIRENLGLTQEAFANVLGVGKKTFARYENGSVTQSVIMNNFLTVIRAMPMALTVLHREQGHSLPHSTTVNPYTDSKLEA
ncbi:MAG: type II toxin-antitoxin system MqsA family antitoxin [Pseudomonadota bacterium]